MDSKNIMGDVVEILSQIEEDFTVPKNIRVKVKNATVILSGQRNTKEMNVSKVLEELDDISEDINLPTYTSLDILRAVSMLESNKK